MRNGGWKKTTANDANFDAFCKVHFLSSAA
jgi:hypothetical protein